MFCVTSKSELFLNRMKQSIGKGTPLFHSLMTHSSDKRNWVNEPISLTSKCFMSA